MDYKVPREKCCPGRLLFFRFIPEASKETQQYCPACQERKAIGRRHCTVQMIPYAWAQIHALLQKFKGIEIRCFDWPHYIQRDHLQKLRCGSKLLPSPGLGFWFEPPPNSFKLCQGTMKAWCTIPRIFSRIQAELSSYSKSLILNWLSGVPTILWLPCKPQYLPPCLFYTFLPHWGASLNAY